MMWPGNSPDFNPCNEHLCMGPAKAICLSSVRRIQGGMDGYISTAGEVGEQTMPYTHL